MSDSESGKLDEMTSRIKEVVASAESHLDADGLLQLRARERESGHDLVIEVSIGLSAAELGDAIDAVSKIAVSG